MPRLQQGFVKCGVKGQCDAFPVDLAELDQLRESACLDPSLAMGHAPVHQPGSGTNVFRKASRTRLVILTWQPRVKKIRQGDATHEETLRELDKLCGQLTVTDRMFSPNMPLLSSKLLKKERHQLIRDSDKKHRKNLKEMRRLACIAVCQDPEPDREVYDMFATMGVAHTVDDRAVSTMVGDEDEVDMALQRSIGQGAFEEHIKAGMERMSTSMLAGARRSACAPSAQHCNPRATSVATSSSRWQSLTMRSRRFTIYR